MLHYISPLMNSPGTKFLDDMKERQEVEQLGERGCVKAEARAQMAGGWMRAYLIAGSLVQLSHVDLLEGNALLLQQELQGLGVLLNL